MFILFIRRIWSSVFEHTYLGIEMVELTLQRTTRAYLTQKNLSELTFYFEWLMIVLILIYFVEVDLLCLSLLSVTYILFQWSLLVLIMVKGSTEPSIRAGNSCEPISFLFFRKVWCDIILGYFRIKRVCPEYGHWAHTALVVWLKGKLILRELVLKYSKLQDNYILPFFNQSL